ncbi:TlpA family protein disulfide reductase [Flavimarina sp. Hel_I_48]|uniref:TlpA family protein disulfide reductase n=1 Tax=Flavimarina sp. Hel_I_48 TaxID=1392488 RepID=UPI0004DEDFCC|nr:TlpA disulfide reductase family protein [Flavimarina sp. Hel_I_48]
MKKDKKQDAGKKTRILYGIFAVVAITLYVTGMHTEVMGFAQRGILATGLFNPDLKEITKVQEDRNNQGDASKLIKADFNLNLIDINGKTVSLKEMKGKVIFMNFWATWCPPCVAEMPSIAKIQEEMGDEVVFVMLSFDNDFEVAKAFTERKDFNLPIYAPADNLPTMYQSSALPTTYIIGADGNLALTHKGMADYSDPGFKKFLNGLK